MFNRRFLSLTQLALWFAIFFSGCSHAPAPQLSAQDLPQDPAQAVSVVEERLQAATEQDVHALAPTAFEHSRECLMQAKEKLKSGDAEATLKHAAEANYELKRATNLADAARTSLSDLLTSRKQAIEAEQAALKENPNDYGSLQSQAKKAEKRFRSLTAALEKNDLGRAEKEKKEVHDDYLLLEETALKKENLDTAKRILNRAKSYQASKYAPKTLGEAEAQIKAAEQYIEKNPNDTQTIKSKSDTAVFAARRALRMAQESRNIAEKKPEEVALWMESNLNDLGKELGQQDLRDRGFNDQLVALRTAAEELRGQQSNLEQNLARTEGAAEMENRIARVRSLFAEGEAEVLQKGNQVVIRLKKMNFPVGSASLNESQFALLGQVKQALEEFPEAKVRVEGHTDSTGSTSLNKRLSQKRAEAVRSYLSENSNLSPDQIEAEGLGSDEPLTTNKTARGRAENRRTDILIDTGISSVAE